MNVEHLIPGFVYNRAKADTLRYVQSQLSKINIPDDLHYNDAIKILKRDGLIVARRDNIWQYNDFFGVFKTDIINNTPEGIDNLVKIQEKDKQYLSKELSDVIWYSKSFGYDAEKVLQETTCTFQPFCGALLIKTLGLKEDNIISSFDIHEKYYSKVNSGTRKAVKDLAVSQFKDILALPEIKKDWVCEAEWAYNGEKLYLVQFREVRKRTNTILEGMLDDISPSTILLEGTGFFEKPLSKDNAFNIGAIDNLAVSRYSSTAYNELMEHLESEHVMIYNVMAGSVMRFSPKFHIVIYPADILINHDTSLDMAKSSYFFSPADNETREEILRLDKHLGEVIVSIDSRYCRIDLK